MLYNKNFKSTQKNTQCLNCELFDKKRKKCNGFGKICFEYDDKIQTVIDPITRLPIKFD